MSAVGPGSDQARWIIPAEQCDVQDKDALGRYRQKRAEWLGWILGEDDHAIGRQIWLMNWSYITFRVINEARRIASRRGLASPVLNDPLFKFATMGFVAIQALAIRRLVEKEARHPELQVVSLRRLVEDIRAHRNLFTRELFVGFDGAPFDPEPGRHRWWEQATKKIEASGGMACWGEEHQTAGPEAWQHAERLHEEFDRLRGVGTKNRARSDRIPDTVFDKLAELLRDPAIGKARELANKRIAHAADAVSRNDAKHGAIGISFHEIDRAHRSLITAANFVSEVMLSQTDIGTVPTSQFDPFEHLDTGGFDEQAVARLSRLANALAERRDRWARLSTDAVLGTGSLEAPHVSADRWGRDVL